MTQAHMSTPALPSPYLLYTTSGPASSKPGSVRIFLVRSDIIQSYPSVKSEGDLPLLPTMWNPKIKNRNKSESASPPMACRRSRSLPTDTNPEGKEKDKPSSKQKLKPSKAKLKGNNKAEENTLAEVNCDTDDDGEKPELAVPSLDTTGTSEINNDDSRSTTTMTTSSTSTTTTACSMPMLTEDDASHKLSVLQKVPLNVSHKQIRRLPSARSNNLSVFSKLFYETFQLSKHDTTVVDGTYLQPLGSHTTRISLQTPDP